METQAESASKLASSPMARELRCRAIRLLARRDYSRVELGRKLLRDVPQVDVADVQEALVAVLDELAAKGLQSDDRAIEAFVQARRDRLGSLRLQHQLAGRGLDPEAAAGALAAVRAEEPARASALRARRFGAPPTDPKEYARQMRFLLARGFDVGTVREVLRAAKADAPAELPLPPLLRRSMQDSGPDGAN